MVIFLLQRKNSWEIFYMFLLLSNEVDLEVEEVAAVDEEAVAEVDLIEVVEVVVAAVGEEVVVTVTTVVWEAEIMDLQDQGIGIALIRQYFLLSVYVDHIIVLLSRIIMVIYFL